MTDESIEPIAPQAETVAADPQLSAAAPHPEPPTTPSTEPAQFPASDALDTAAFEQQFGYAPGSFAGAKNLDDVLAKIASSPFDGLFDGTETDDTDPSPVSSPAAPQAGESYEELKQRLAWAESQLQQNDQARQAELGRRIDASINGFASTKYGVGVNRNLAQTRAAAAFKQKLLTHIAGLKEGDTVPVVEILARQLRQFDDDTFRPDAKPVDRTPLGTPGTSKESRGQAATANQPRNIHEKLLRNMTV